MMLALPACASPNADEIAASDAGDVQGWKLASGKPPSPAEYAAVVAACEADAIPMTQGRPLPECLADLGLRHAP